MSSIPYDIYYIKYTAESHVLESRHIVILKNHSALVVGEISFELSQTGEYKLYEEYRTLSPNLE